MGYLPKTRQSYSIRRRQKKEGSMGDPGAPQTRQQSLVTYSRSVPSRGMRDCYLLRQSTADIEEYHECF